MVAIGIDLGTTNSCVAVWRRGRVEIIANDLGHRITPSCVAFDEEERFIGKPAVGQTTKNPRNTVYEVKRLIGRKFDDPLVQGDMKNWPFLVVDVEGSPRIQVEYKKETKVFAPEEISAMVLGKLKDTAERYLDCEVTDAVITVPAYFNDAQRQATIDAGEIAGLNVLRIINEPTAAALAYGLNTTLEEKRTVLIYDLGGGTFDVSIVRIEHGPKVEVLASTGDTHLGGSDFDHLVVKHLAELFKEKSKKDIYKSESPNDVNVNAKSLSKLRTEAVKSKVMLSSNFKDSIHVDALKGGVDFSSLLTRAKFECICDPLFRSTLDHVNKAMKDAGLKKSAIDEVVLVGGSTRIPMIKKILQEFFEGKSLKETINPDEAVAYGAAIQAAILSGDTSLEFEDVSYNDVSSISLGTELKGGVMDVVIKKNTRIPCSISRTYVTSHDNQTTMTVKVYEGEEKMTKDNRLLGEFVLDGIPPAPAGKGSTLDTFNLNDNGILTVTSVEKVTSKSKSIAIRVEKGLDEKDIVNMKKTATELKKDDESGREEVVLRYQNERLASRK